jgi:hypothetical protein
VDQLAIRLSRIEALVKDDRPSHARKGIGLSSIMAGGKGVELDILEDTSEPLISFVIRICFLIPTSVFVILK